MGVIRLLVGVLRAYAPFGSLRQEAMGVIGLLACLGLGAAGFAQTAGVVTSAAPQTPSAGERSEVTDPKQLCKVEGRVVNAVTGEPLRKVSLTLRRMAASADTLIATSDQEGRFVFENVEPGTYQLIAERAGFLRQAYGSRSLPYAGTPIALSAGQHLKELEFKLLPQGVISGRVVDEEGEPVPQVQVMAVRPGRGRAGASLRGSAMSNDVGEFRISGLAPGRYLLRAMPMGRLRLFAETVRPGNPNVPEEGFLPTYYPSAPDPEGAAAVEVGAGQEVPGITILLRKGPLYRIQGRVVGLTAERPASQVRVAVVPRGRDVAFMGMSASPGASVQADGSFLLTGVAPGSYYVTVTTFPGLLRALARVPVEVTSSDLKDVIVPMGASLTLSGTVRVEGEQKRELGTVRAGLAPVEGVAFSPLSAEVKADGTFQIQDVMPDKYYVNVSASQGDVYVKSLRIGGREAPDRELDLSNAEGHVQIEIVLSPQAATLEGTVMDGDKPAAGMFVVLAPEPFREEQQYLVRSAVSDQNGRFQLRALRPGEYRLYAFEDPEVAYDRSPEALKPFEQHALKVTLKEGERQAVQAGVLKAREAGAR
ncbi:MAG TPA: carboxypeptidase-like regulatory domain-containing protein [Bryobacteraceae bacterium]|nr:carboxypeptidase-like regulatory domain-containing protein [Bryobacteraceae bacterium]